VLYKNYHPMYTRQDSIPQPITPQAEIISLDHAARAEKSRPYGRTLIPRGQVVSQGWRSSVHPSILLNIRECPTLWVKEGPKFTPRCKVHPWGQTYNA
jgi:hypothetical protein